MSIIHVSNLSKAFRVLKRKSGFLGSLRTLFSSNYEQVQAVQDISFAIAPGELVGYIGPNGAGKSTTIKSNLTLFTELLDLGALLDRPVRQLSLGQRMRCELVASLLHDPKVIYLDEPTIGLDVVAKERIREFIQHLHQQRGVTVMLTTHDIADIEKLCKRVLIIDKGQLIYDGSLSAIKQRYGRRRRVIFTTAAGAAPAGLETELAALGDGIQVTPGEEGKVVVSFDPHSVPVSALTRTIVNHHVVTDLSVEEADLEGIIRQIYGGAHSLGG
jgi:ABC-2 type transport system ATP-binding protein